MRYFLAIFGLCVLAVMGVLGRRGDHFRKPPLYIFPEWNGSSNCDHKRTTAFLPMG